MDQWMDLFTILIILLAYNVVANKLIPRRGDMIFSVGVTIFVVWVAVKDFGFTLGDLGIAPSHFVDGLIVGVVASLAIAAVIATLVALKKTRHLFKDARAKDLSIKELLGKLLIRIPISTVIIEEVLFRGVVLALLLDLTNQIWAVVLSSVLFGLWHILPSLSASEFDATLTKKMGKPVSLVSGTILVTFLAGILLAVFRIWTGSLITPMLIHFTLNASGFLGAWFTQRK